MTDYTTMTEDELAAIRAEAQSIIDAQRQIQLDIQAEIDRRREAGDLGISVDPDAPVYTIGG